jgi:excisionase family DNA binding protein
MNQTDGDKLAYRIDEAVKATGVGRTKLYEAMAAGQIQARKFGNRTLILRRDLEQFLDSLKVA